MAKSEIDSLLADIDRDQVSKLLSRARRIVQKRSEPELERWLRLELEGYFGHNPALRETDVVPEYRTIIGQHTDEFGRPLLIQDPNLAFVNENRVRWGAADLEVMLAKGGMVITREPYMAAGIKQYLDVEVTRYTFTAMQLEGVLAAIRLRLSDALCKLEPIASRPSQKRPHTEVAPPDEILEVRPNVFGVGLNLRALFRWLSRRRVG